MSHTNHSLCIDHGKKGDKDGYCPIERNGFRRLHREVYAQTHGLTAESMRGLVVRHSCDNSRCINPEHLSIGTQADNIRDMLERNRGAHHMRRKLSDSDADYIRANCKTYARGGFSQKAMAIKFGVDRSVIKNILDGRTYFKKAPA